MRIKMRRDNFKNKSYTKFFISYMAILFIPIFIITIILSKTVFNILETEIQNRDKLALNYSSHLLNSNFNDCIKISDNLLSRDNIKPFKLNEDITESIRTISILNKYSALNNFFNKIFIHFFNDSYVYSDTGSYTLDSFYKTYKSAENVNSNLHTALTSISSPMFIEDFNNNTLYYAIPYLLNSDVVGSVIFSINMNTINSIINYADTNRYSFIVDSNYNIVNLSSINIDEYKDIISEFILTSKDKLKSNKPFTTTLNKQSIFLNKFNFDNSYFLSVTSSRTLYNELSNVSQLLLLSIILAFILGSIAIHFLLKINYKPIKHLKELSKKLHIESSNDNDYNEYNEFDLIENTIHFLTEKNTELEYEMRKNIPLMQNFMLNELIDGTVSDKNRFITEALEIGLSFNSKYHSIVVLRLKNFNDPWTGSLNELLAKYNMQNFSIDYEFLVNTFGNELFIFLVGFNSQTIDIAKMQSLDENTAISIGSIQEDLSLLGKSYIDARTNLEVSSSIENNNQIKDFVNKYDNILKDVRFNLDNDNISEVASLLSSISSELIREKLPFKLVRSIYFELVIMFNTYIDKNKHSINYNNIDLATLYQIKTLDELNDVFNEISSELLDLIENKRTIEVPKLTVDKIKEYILENYTDYSFSLQLVSDKFNVSLSYLSQYFKDKTGMTILDYITNLKMNKAKTLLTTSDLTLKDIADQIGYSNVSSFIRRFKQVTSMTPGEYKKNNKTDLVEDMR